MIALIGKVILGIVVAIIMVAFILCAAAADLEEKLKNKK